jgi:hypothetical protein
MRDGIYKNPLLPAPWRSFLRSCTLDAERGEVAREKCERAIGGELRDIGPQFSAAFHERTLVGDSLLPGFKAFGVEVTVSDLGGLISPVENRVLKHARRLESAGLKGAELERGSYDGALQETADAQVRLIEQTVVTSGSDSDAKATLSAVRDAIRSARIAPMVERFIAGRPLDLAPARRPIDLDEDLSRFTHESS